MVVVAVASGPPELADRFVRAASKLAGDRPFYVVSELPPSLGVWIPYRFERTRRENLERCLAELDGKKIRLCCVLLTGQGTLAPMRDLAFQLAPLRGVYFNENLDHFMLRPRCVWPIFRYIQWRVRDWLRFQFRPGGRVYTFFWRLFHPGAWERPMLYRRALQNGRHLALERPGRVPLPPLKELPDGTAVVIPSRNGRVLLETCLPLVLAQSPDQVVVVDNGSTDRTIEWLAGVFPEVEVEVSDEPLSFASAVNRGIRGVRFSHVCLLNNDMEIEPGFFGALRRAFDRRDDLFCATAEKTVMPPRLGVEDFPIRCAEPINGENYSDVLYGRSGCSMYRTAMLEALGGFDEKLMPVHMEDLDLGYRGWLAGGATLFVSDAKLLQPRGATASEQLELAVEQNYLRFLKRSISSPEQFGRLWQRAVDRLNHMAAKQVPPPVPVAALRFASALDARRRQLPAIASDETIFALGSGEFARFPGKSPSGKPVIVVASCYAPYPLAHGGAVRIFNLMSRAAADFDQVLVYFADELRTPSEELLQLAVEVIVVKRRGSHAYSCRELPDAVQDFRSEAFRAVLRSAVRQWSAEIVQLEFTQLAQYAKDCAPARTVLVEHDITIDLYRQLLETATGSTRWEIQFQLTRWERFERRAWRDVDRVVVMSERDRAAVGGGAAVIPNGVDTARFQPSPGTCEPGRLLFIGSFAHLPNVLAVKFFVDQVWPGLRREARLHIIAGERPEYYLDFYRNQAPVDVSSEAIELEAFVPDVRPAYQRAQIFIAPLLASAGTNIKILEAMAMGKAIVATPAAIHGLELRAGSDLLVVDSAEAMARAIRGLIADPRRCEELGATARVTVCAQYDWDRIAEMQRQIYRDLRGQVVLPGATRNGRVVEKAEELVAEFGGQVFD